MNVFGIAIPIISHIIAGLYLQKRKYNKFITAAFWGLFVLLSGVMLVIFKGSPFVFLGLLLVQFAVFSITTVGRFSEKFFLFLTYANSFSICIGINFMMFNFLQNEILIFIIQIAIVIIMHLFVYKVLLFKYKAAKKFFTAGWWKMIIVLLLFLMQFLNEYAFKIVDKSSAVDLLLDFVIFGVIFNATLIIIFDFVKNVSETNKKIFENEVLKDIANKDALTNMRNRLAYVSFIEEKTNNFENENFSFVFAMLDIDNFKNINDTKGHAEGDKALKVVAASIAEHFENIDCNCFRIGGDEFVLLIENMQLSDVEESVDELNQKLLKNNNITVSYGCATVDFEDKKPFESAYKKADSIMYNNKQLLKANA